MFDLREAWVYSFDSGKTMLIMIQANSVNGFLRVYHSKPAAVPSSTAGSRSYIIPQAHEAIRHSSRAPVRSFMTRPP